MMKLICAVLVSVATLPAPHAAIAQTAAGAASTSRDAWTTTQIRAKFFLDRDLKVRNLDVDTVGGVVTLRGEVRSDAERERAIAQARSTEGVTQVIDTLTVTAVQRPATGPAAEWPARTAQGKTAVDRIEKEISDTWITTKVQAIFFLDRDVKGTQIDVGTKNGVVTLTGTVPSEAARQKALGDAKSVDGVKQVVDKLAVRP